MADKAKNSQPTVIILAAGKGTRMRSGLPKVLHPLAGKSMLAHVLDAVAEINPSRVGVVIAPGMDDVQAEALRVCEQCHIAIQDSEQVGHGTAAAVKAAKDIYDGADGPVLVLFGDTPLLTPTTLQHMAGSLAAENQPAVSVLGMRPRDPAEYGRLVLGSKLELLEIVEFKDASPQQKDIGLCNSGVMAIRGDRLPELLSKVSNKNAKGEYYLTDLVKIAREEGEHCTVYEANEAELLGVNSRVQQAQAEAELQSRYRRAAMEAGVTLVAPETVFFSHDTQLAADVLVHPHVVFGPGVVVDAGVEIRAFSHLEGAHVRNDAVVGPYARLRPGADIGEDARIGNFVEIKKSTLARGAKVSHLSYIGDAEVGEESNIGAGTITCNYDGFNKHLTRIGKGAFIGSNTALVAPVSVGDGAIVGAGSTITEDIESDALAFTRPQQSQKPGWAKKFRELKQKVKA